MRSLHLRGEHLALCPLVVCARKLGFNQSECCDRAVFHRGIFNARLIKMRRPIFFRRTVWFLMFVMLMTGVGVWSFGSRWVSHELEHDSNFILANPVNHSHGHQPDDFGAPDKEPLSETEHQLLHAASHFAEPFPLPAMSGIPAVPSGSFQSWFVLRTPPTTKFERTFRPPRNALFLI